MTTESTTARVTDNPSGMLRNTYHRATSSSSEAAGGYPIAKRRILIVDPNLAFRERLAREFRAEGYDVATADTGDRAFLLLRDWQNAIDWLYSRATLPGLIDGWILADEYHNHHPHRPAVISAACSRASAQGHVILEEPALTTVLETLRRVIHADPAAQLNSLQIRQAA